MFNLENFLAETRAQELRNDRYLVTATRRNERLLKKAIRRKLVDLDRISSMYTPTRKQSVGKPEVINVAYGFDQETTFIPTSYTAMGYIVTPRRKTAPVPTVWTRTAVPHW